ncbi:MAG: hypothetical protein HN561_07190 [Candidatus Scalindua sp.]|jgi:hypothetical protein|nr:hypothetical protein [Candidatus Scalindua sp.]MBT7590838.1 hypothetical protein [Candidatus Scalindua sp.]
MSNDKVLKTGKLGSIREDFIRKATNLKIKAWVFFGMAMIALIGGGVFFVFAGVITQNEISSYESNFFPIKDKMRTLEYKYIKSEEIRSTVLSEAQKGLKRINKDTKELSDVEIISLLHNNWSAVLEASDESQSFYLTKAVRELRIEAGPLDKDISLTYEKLQQSIDNNIANRKILIKKEKVSNKEKDDSSFYTIYMIYLNVTRFGVLTIFLIVARSLLSVYRYKMGLCTFYESRSVALQLFDDKVDLDIECLERVVSCLTPGKEINIPEIVSGKQQEALTRELLVGLKK